MHARPDIRVSRGMTEAEGRAARAHASRRAVQTEDAPREKPKTPLTSSENRGVASGGSRKRVDESSPPLHLLTQEKKDLHKAAQRNEKNDLGI